jgi:hypothetical protein
MTNPCFGWTTVPPIYTHSCHGSKVPRRERSASNEILLRGTGPEAPFGTPSIKRRLRPVVNSLARDRIIKPVLGSGKITINDQVRERSWSILSEFGQASFEQSVV